MSIQQNDFVPSWVRTGFCITAYVAILGLIYIASTGENIPLGLTAMVGIFVLNVSGYAFHGKFNAGSIVEFLKKFKN